MIQKLFFLILFWVCSETLRAQPSSEIDPILDTGDFKTVLTRLNEVNLIKATQLFPQLVTETGQHFTILQPSTSPLIIQARALFARGFQFYLMGSTQAALERWSEGIQLLSQVPEPDAEFDLRRLSTAIFLTASEEHVPSVETFNRALKVTAEQIDQLSLPNQTDAFTNQLKTEFEIYSAHQVLASIFTEEAKIAGTELWTDLLARRTLTHLLHTRHSDTLRARAHESVFDVVFYSAKNRRKFQENVLKHSLRSLLLVDSNRYSIGIARLTMLNALFFADTHKAFPVREHITEAFKWPAFSSELIAILKQTKTAGESDLSTRLLKSIAPVLDQIVLSPDDELALATALIDADIVKEGYHYCLALTKRDLNQGLQSRLHALSSIALAKQGKFTDSIELSDKLVQPQFLAIDEFVSTTYYRSLAYAQLANPQASIAESIKLLKIAPNHKLASAAQLNMAFQYINQGKKEKARIALEEYIARYPNTASINFVRKFLAEL